MIRLVRNNNPFTVIILLIFALLAKMRALLHPVAPVMLPHHFLYNFILKWLDILFRDNAFGYTMFAIVMLFMQSLYLKRICNRHKLFLNHTYIPSYVYLLLTSIYTPFNYFNETIIENWVLLSAVNIMLGFTQSTQPRKLIFNAAFLLCMTALFQFTGLAYFLLLLVGMAMFQSFNLGEWTVAMIGYLTPLYFMVSILFLIDRFYLIPQWAHIGFSISPHISSLFYTVTVLTGIVAMLVGGLFAMQQNVAISNIYVRRDCLALSFYLIISLMVAFLTDIVVKSAWLMLMPPLSIVIAHAFMLEKDKRFSNFIFYFSLVFLIVCIIADK